jgi:hypothetical protein
MLKFHKFPLETIRMIEDLGPAGMSSEESEGEIGTLDRKYKVKRLEWRSRELTTFLHQVDELPTSNSENEIRRQLAPSRERVQKDIDSVGRPAIPELNQNLYDADWLRRQDDRTRHELKVRESLFPIPVIKEYVNYTTPYSP